MNQQTYRALEYPVCELKTIILDTEIIAICDLRTHRNKSLVGYHIDDCARGSHGIPVLAKLIGGIVAAHIFDRMIRI